jgi:hypothetical protein
MTTLFSGFPNDNSVPAVAVVPAVAGISAVVGITAVAASTAVVASLLLMVSLLLNILYAWLKRIADIKLKNYCTINYPN